MTKRLVLSELRILIEHFTTAPKPDPDFMRSHASALMSAVDSWADEQEEEDARNEPPLENHG